jgi:putative transposase
MNNLILRRCVFAVAGWVNRGQQQAIAYLVEENQVLREQLRGRRRRLTDTQRRRLAVRAKAMGRKALTGMACIVTPDTLLRWYRNLVARKYDGSHRRGSGWRPTEPAPQRSERTPWATFLKAHWGATAAMDFFTVEVLTMHGLARYSILFAIDLKTRCIHLAGIAHDPHGAWMEQVARNLTDAVTGFLRNTRYLIHDRDPLFTERLTEILRAAGVKTVKLPARSPDRNAFAERFVLSVRTECLRRVIPLGEKHLRTILSEFLIHYHSERNHQGLGNELLTPLPANTDGAGSVYCRERLGGVLNYYYREAA